MSKRYELETIMKQWAATKYKNKVVVVTFAGIQRWDELVVDTFDMESEALDFLQNELGDNLNSDDFFMFDFREGVVQPTKRKLKSKDNVIVLGGKYKGKHGVYLCSALDDELERPFGYQKKRIELGNSLVRILDTENDEMYVEEIPTKDLDLDE